MTENPQQTDPDVPHEDELDIEGPNESGPGHHPAEDDDSEADS